MKKLFIILCVLLIGCIGMQIKGPQLDLPEIEGAELKTVKELVGHSLSTIQSWKIDETQTARQKPHSGALGLSFDHEYDIVGYVDPASVGKLYMLLSIVVDGKPVRVERVGVFLRMPWGQYSGLAFYDRYKNTDKWYQFERTKFLEQHPEKPEPAKADPNRFKRQDGA